MDKDEKLEKTAILFLFIACAEINTIFFCELLYSEVEFGGFGLLCEQINIASCKTVCNKYATKWNKPALQCHDCSLNIAW